MVFRFAINHSDKTKVQSDNNLTYMQRFILVALLERSLTARELEEKVLLLIFQLGIENRRDFDDLSSSLMKEGERYVCNFLPFPPLGKLKKVFSRKDFSIQKECKELLKKGFVSLDETSKYTLTAEGKDEAERIKKTLMENAEFIRRNFLSVEAAARNTTIIKVFLTFLKISVAFVSGSIAILADGADEFMDVISAAILWLILKRRKEIVGTIIIILMMFVTSFGIGYKSIDSIYRMISFGGSCVIQVPYLVVFTEFVALIFAFTLSMYQRFVGKQNKSLTLLSQSLDSRNHVYISLMVIFGVVLSVYKIYYIDVFIALGIAGKFFFDAVKLSKEAFLHAKGREMGFLLEDSNMENFWKKHKVTSFRRWILYSVGEGLRTKEELIHSLKKAFCSSSIPFLDEFRFKMGKGVDFSMEFDNLMKPLLEEGLVAKRGDFFELTRDGKKMLRNILGKMRYLDTT